MLHLADLDHHDFDVLVVGGGPSGAACALWLARAGWSVCLSEKKSYPRVKTCGDGLTPRSVHQLAQMGLEKQVAEIGHRYSGLRAHGFGARLELQWPEHRTFPNYGYTITRYDLDGLVAARAEELGATLLVGAEAVEFLEPSEAHPGRLPGARGVRVRDTQTSSTAEIFARYIVVADGQNSRLGRELGVERVRAWPMGMALRGYYTSERSPEAWIDSHLDIRDPNGDVVPGYGWIFPLGDGRVNVGVGLLSTAGAWKGVNTSKLQDYFVAQVGEEWGLSEATSLGAPTGGRLPMGLARGPRVGENIVVVGDAAGSINPFNGEGIAYGYETGRLGAHAIATALASEDASALELYEDSLQSAYGEYYKVARAFVRLISEPSVLAICVAAGMRIEPVMRELLRLMANLMNNDRNGAAELGFRSLSRLLELVPESVLDRLLGQGD